MNRKKPSTVEQNKYKRYCKIRYYAILFAYIYEFLVKLLLCSLTIQWTFIAFEIHIPIKILAITGIVLYLIAKWYLLRNTKFRKKGFYDRRT